MRQLTITIEFVTHCLGNVKRADGAFMLPRSPSGAVVFMPSWHQANMRIAAQMLGRHQKQVDQILWSLEAEVRLDDSRWYRRYYRSGNGKTRRYCLHEAILPGQRVKFRCAVPSDISDADVAELMKLAGEYRGLSPWRPGEWGFFRVVDVSPAFGKREGCHESPATA